MITPDGVTSGPEETPSAPGPGEEMRSEVESPAKILRIGSMLKQLLEEARNTELDERARDQLRSLYQRAISELESSLSPDLGEELNQLSLEFPEGDIPTEAELRIAQAQLVGWLEGLFQGIQATLVAQQMAARHQLEGMRGQLEPPHQDRPGTYL